MTDSRVEAPPAPQKKPGKNKHKHRNPVTEARKYSKINRAHERTQKPG